MSRRPGPQQAAPDWGKTFPVGRFDVSYHYSTQSAIPIHQFLTNDLNYAWETSRCQRDLGHEFPTFCYSHVLNRYMSSDVYESIFLPRLGTWSDLFCTERALHIAEKTQAPDISGINYFYVSKCARQRNLLSVNVYVCYWRFDFLIRSASVGCYFGRFLWIIFFTLMRCFLWSCWKALKNIRWDFDCANNNLP